VWEEREKKKKENAKKSVAHRKSFRGTSRPAKTQRDPPPSLRLPISPIWAITHTSSLGNGNEQINNNNNKKKEDKAQADCQESGRPATPANGPECDDGVSRLRGGEKSLQPCPMFVEFGREMGNGTWSFWPPSPAPGEPALY